MQKLALQLPVRQPAIRLDNVGKRYGERAVVDALSLTVMPGETFALFGPSGCGKTSTLRLVAGLDAPDWGEIFLHGSLMSSAKRVVPPHKRRIGMVFQDLALWPHMTVAQHIDFALPAATKKGERQEAICAVLDLVQLPRHKSYPCQLSGGERRRLAIARALAAQPQILIMDEPFVSLDNRLKSELLGELKNLVARLGITMLYVTHEWLEVLQLADSIAVMAEARIVRSGPVEDFDKDKPMRSETKKIVHLPTRSLKGEEQKVQS